MHTRAEFQRACQRYVERLRPAARDEPVSAAARAALGRREVSRRRVRHVRVGGVRRRSVASTLSTWETRVDDFVAVQEVGKVINPVLAAGQIEGGVAQGIGWALYENVVWRDGRMANAQMTNYIMPTSMDLPPIRVVLRGGAVSARSGRREGHRRAADGRRRAGDLQRGRARHRRRRPTQLPADAGAPDGPDGGRSLADAHRARHLRRQRPPRSAFEAHPMARLLDVAASRGAPHRHEGRLRRRRVRRVLRAARRRAGQQLPDAAAQADGGVITTIEGVADGRRAARVQEAFLECGGAQCGICTPGMVLAAVDLLSRNPEPTEADVRAWLAGNLCRCTGYMRIFESVLHACRQLPHGLRQ